MDFWVESRYVNTLYTNLHLFNIKKYYFIKYNILLKKASVKWM